MLFPDFPLQLDIFVPYFSFHFDFHVLGYKTKLHRKYLKFDNLVFSV